ncbi:hypothetical protein ACFSTH_18990 [Paenibacillus yanchengensis]|uniref:Uncharacterized protein n=1 Tax=Paenibacillus yanchengensis TaxID=2035833 RepID=A0ABW4YLJ3_9BACL
MNKSEKGSVSMKETAATRMEKIIYFSAERALEQPLLASGLWHHHDIRNNFYDASYIIAAATLPSLTTSWNKEEARRLAEKVLLQLLRLQDRQVGSTTYGHWPLNAHPEPTEAPKNTLPAELMGLLLAYFNKQYRPYLSPELQLELNVTLTTLHKSDFYKVPMVHYNHHEAKYTAAKLIYGTLFQDEALLEEGNQCLTETLQRIKQVGMTEYGCLPWFWHWVQSFTSAYYIVERDDIVQTIKEMLDYLWYERAHYYWQGAWVGPHSRSLPHDLPADGNVLFDYVQFGDIPFPTVVPRIEYAGLLYSAAPAEAMQLLTERQYPHTLQRLVAPKPQASNYDVLHSYVYMTDCYAVGGMWERATEFDNEQMRWAITLPATGDGKANRAYFFHPGVHFAGKDSEDWRHQSDVEQVVYNKGAVLAVYDDCGSEHPYIVGCLPHGTWLHEPLALYGMCGDNYIAVHLQHPYQAEQRANAWRIISEGSNHAVAIEVMSKQEARERNMEDVQQFAAVMRQHALKIAADSLEVVYVTSAGEKLQLAEKLEQATWEATINEQVVDWQSYTY